MSLGHAVEDLQPRSRRDGRAGHHGLFPNGFVPVVQWIELAFPKRPMRVRFSPGIVHQQRSWIPEAHFVIAMIAERAILG